MASGKTALVLLHGILMSRGSWQDVVPLLSDHHDVHAVTTAGHRGGPPIRESPVTVDHLVDAVEAYLDEHGLDRPHLAGLSLGGWMAIELARRGRAATVCALAPGGFWTPGDAAQAHARKKVHQIQTLARIAGAVRPVAAAAMKSGAVRRIGFRDAARHADRITAAQSMALLGDATGATINVDDILASGEHLAALNPLPCPVTIAWSGDDKLITGTAHEIARDRLPQASTTTLPGVGHVPMIDDPALVARTILAVTGAGADRT